MTAWWDGLSLLQKVLYTVAIPSTLIMLIQTVMLLFGLGHDASGDGPIDGSAGHDLPHDALATCHTSLPSHLPTHIGQADTPAETGHAAMDGSAADAAAFHVFSVRGVLAFFVFFGWVGLAMASLAVPVAVVVLAAFVAGLAGLYLTAWMVFAMQKLQATGNVDLRNAVGQAGEVYIPVPAGQSGSGKVNVLVQGRYMECDAMTQGAALKTGQLVVVTGLVGSSVLMVEATAPKAG